MTIRPRNLSSFPHARSGVTLIEILLAMSILVVVSSMTYWFYASTLETGDRTTDNAYRLRLARVLLDHIAKEIRQSAGITVDDRVGITGEPERILLSSYRVPSREQIKERTARDAPRPAEYDLTKLEYKIARHPEVLDDDGYEIALGLARNEIPIPRPLPVNKIDEFEDEVGAEQEDEFPVDGEFSAGAEESGDVGLGPDINWDELYAPEIRYLRFCYFDGFKWWDSWSVTGESPLPQLVQVTIGYEGHPAFGEEFGIGLVNEEFCTCLNEDPVDCLPLASDQYAMVVRVPQADPLFRSRINRETQALMEAVSDDEEDNEEGGQP